MLLAVLFPLLPIHIKKIGLYILSINLFSLFNGKKGYFIRNPAPLVADIHNTIAVFSMKF